MANEDAQTRRLPLHRGSRRRSKRAKSDAARGNDADDDSDSAPPPQPRVGAVTSRVAALWLPELHEEQCVVYGAGKNVVFEGLKEVKNEQFFLLRLLSDEGRPDLFPVLSLPFNNNKKKARLHEPHDPEGSRHAPPQPQRRRSRR